MSDNLYYGLGRRKSSVAKVVLTPGTGKLTVNKCDPSKYFPDKIIIQDLEQPLELTNTKTNYDINVVVSGGGFSGQSGAIRLGIARALVKVNPEFKKLLKQRKLVTRDARSKERKKFGLYGARRAPQFTKR